MRRILIAIALLWFAPYLALSQTDQIRVKRMIASDIPWTDVISYNTAVHPVDRTGSTDSTAGIQAAIDAAEASSGSKIVRFPAGKYKITSTLTVIEARLQGAIGFNSELDWYGATGGTMLTVGESHSTSIENLYFNARQIAGKGIHIGGGDSAVSVRNMAIRDCVFMNFSIRSVDTYYSAIYLGDYTAYGVHSDIAQLLIDHCEFLDCYYGVNWDSNQALGIQINNCFFSRITPNTNKHHIHMLVGGGAAVYKSYFGGDSEGGLDFPIYIRNGWINVSDSDFEWGISGGLGGTMHLDTPEVSVEDTSVGMPCIFSNNRVLGYGQYTTGNYILISSSNHPLTLIGNSFHGKESLGTYAINNSGGSPITSIGNLYRGRFWNTVAQDYITSIRDQYDDGSTITLLPTIIGKQKVITSASSPYTVTNDDETIVVESGATTVNLPLINQPYYGGSIHRTITVKRAAPSGTTTIAAYAGNTIDGAETFSLENNPYASVTFESDGSSKWYVKSFYSPGEQGAASTGNGLIKMAGTKNSYNTGWVQLSPGKYVPYWTTVEPTNNDAYTSALTETSDAVAVNAALVPDGGLFTLQPADDGDAFTLSNPTNCYNGKRFFIRVYNNATAAGETISYGVNYTVLGGLGSGALSTGNNDTTLLGFVCSGTTAADVVSVSRTTAP